MGWLGLRFVEVESPKVSCHAYIESERGGVIQSDTPPKAEGNSPLVVSE